MGVQIGAFINDSSFGEKQFILQLNFTLFVSKRNDTSIYRIQDK